MKKLLKKALSLTIVLAVVLSVTVTAFAAPSNYSTSKNSGKRDEVCTTLNGTSASSYYTGKYTYDNLESLSQSQLLSSLRALMTDTHKKQTSYDNCRDYAPITDCEGGNGKIVTLYTSYSTTSGEYNSGNGWNREHVWPQSLGGFKTSGPGADLHHIRPTENRTNSNRGNNKYGEVSGGSQSKGNLSGLVGGTYGGGYFEPLDNVKGDVARICLYVYVRWGGNSSYSCGSLTKVFSDIDTLLEWCALDPVDTWEMGRNEVIEDIQGNRNVFIDYPELAWLVLGKEVPENMVTPSGEAMKNNSGDIGSGDNGNTDSGNTDSGNTDSGNTDNGNTDSGNTDNGNNNNGSNDNTSTACEHIKTMIVCKEEATCVSNGYTGELVCQDCGVIIVMGEVVFATGHYYGEEKITQEPTETEDGESVKSCEKCDYTVTVVIPALGVEEDLGFFARLIAMIKEFFASIFGTKA